jgi:hypothetical protein
LPKGCFCDIIGIAMKFDLDRRVIFVLIALAVALPLAFKLNLPISVTPEVRSLYDAIEALQPGDVVLVSFDHETSTIPEMVPMAQAILRHLFSRGVKVIGTAFLAEGTTVGDNNLTSVASEYGKQYGEDYVFLGYRPQYHAAILGMGENMARVFPEDLRGNTTVELPLFQNVKNYNDVKFVISIADGNLPDYWIDYAWSRYHVKMAAGVTAVMATTYYPMLNSGQLFALVPGLKGAAEYEILESGKPGKAGSGMDAQSVSHLLIIALIILGNLLLFYSRRRPRER